MDRVPEQVVSMRPSTLKRVLGASITEMVISRRHFCEFKSH